MTFVAQPFEAIVGATNVLTDAQHRRLYSQDVFNGDDGPIVDAVIRPADTAEVSAVVKVAAAQGLAIAPRGGGVSYTKGYVPDRAGTVLIDLARLNRIHEIAADDLYITVGAGCTWQQAAESLKGSGLRAVMKGPISGTHATVGGVAAQNSASDNMAAILALEAVTADGRVIRTGSSAIGAKAGPFYRYYGPDLTGLLLGDTGTFAIKTALTLALEPEPRGAAFASIGFETLSAMSDIMVAIARSGIKCKTLGMDPVKNRTATKVGVKEGLGTLAKVITAARSVTEGLKQAAKIAVAGQNVLADIPWSLHVTVEGHDQPAADHALAALRPIWTHRGREIEPSVPIAMRARPYSIRGIVGIAGERWVPVHGVFPLSKAQRVVSATEDYFTRHKARLDRHKIDHSFLTMVLGNMWLIEPMFYWFDELSALHATVLGDKFAKFKDIPANPAARAVVKELRGELAALFKELGAVHSQLGKFYDFAGNISPDTYAVLTSIKDALDPERRLNPGNLGWG
ncbi:MAG: FAD-binding oxidoreductase [Alphaproteobacteria bacterium]|nr:FAD-binding oxidoreductase [Alphaproteobacteria bacterium]